MNTYDIGDEITFVARFVNRLGVSTNPAAVTGAVKLPDGTLSALAWLATATVGTYEAVFDPTVKGKHWYSVNGTGNGIKAAQEVPFMVEEKKVI